MEQDLAERNRAIIDFFTSGHFTMRAIGEHFGVHYSRMSRIVGAAARTAQDLTPIFCYAASAKIIEKFAASERSHTHAEGNGSKPF